MDRNGYEVQVNMQVELNMSSNEYKDGIRIENQVTTWMDWEMRIK